MSENNTDKAKYDLSKDRVLYAIGYSHLDTQWRWDFVKTIRDYLRVTLEETFDRLEKYPDFVFNFTGSIRYEMMKEYYPDYYERVKEYIEQGRWFVSGSSVEECDVLAPSVESQIRQILLGNEYYRREFGRCSVDFFLPDCFGFMAHTPSIWRHCGLLGFSTQKLIWGGSGIPFTLGLWQGTDGHDIIVAIDPGRYEDAILTPAHQEQSWSERITDNGQRYGLFAEYHYYGVGDIGGAPREEDVINYTQAARADDGLYRVCLAASDALFGDITPEQRAKLPVYKGDFLLTEHSAGSITSQAAMKQWNRRNEQLADAAERAAVAAKWLGERKYPAAKLEAAWLRLLACQFHDILPGTSIPRAYEYSWNDEAVAENLFRSIENDNALAVADRLNTNGAGVPVVVYNPLGAGRSDLGQVELSVNWQSAPDGVMVTDGAGLKAAGQVISRSGNNIGIIFPVQAEPLSWQVYHIAPAVNKTDIGCELKISETMLENERYRVEFDSSGDPVSIWDKLARRELLSAPARLAFIYHKPARFPAWNMEWQHQSAPPAGYVEGPAKFEIVESGPVRVKLAVTRTARGSVFRQEYSLHCGGDTLRVDNVFDWQTSGYALKAVFPLTVSNPLATYNLGLGTIKRGNNNEKKYEVPSYQWFDLTDTNGAYGVSFLENGRIGSDKPSDNVVRLTLLYTPDVDQDRDYPEQSTQDWGCHEFSYALYGHCGSWQGALPEWPGRRLNQPLRCRQVEKHSGDLGSGFSLAAVNDARLDLRAVKQALRDEELIIVRVQELSGSVIENAQINFAGEIAEAWEVDGQEFPLAAARVENGCLYFKAGPYSLHSFALRLKPSAAGKPSLGQALALPYNAAVMTSDADRSAGEMVDGLSYAAELVPPRILCEQVEFELCPPENKGRADALICAGQKLLLPGGNYERLYLLMAADADLRADFVIGSHKSDLAIQSWTGFVGQWYARKFCQEMPENCSNGTFTLREIVPAYTKPATIAWFGKHRHSRSVGNDPYQFTYMYKYELSIPAGARSIELPNDTRVKIFAATVK